MKIIIASTNPVKINATKNGFQKVFSKKKIKITGKALPSGVSDQPMSEEETIMGSLNRARNAKEKFPDAEYWVGIEGGIAKVEKNMLAFSWVTIINEDQIGKGRTSSYFLPKKIGTLIEKGHEIGSAFDEFFNAINTKQQNGAIGVLTKNLITRLSEYEPAVIIALIPFVNEGLYT